nr:hypothetical protein [uncultured Rhodopila sp.]
MGIAVSHGLRPQNLGPVVWGRPPEAETTRIGLDDPQDAAAAALEAIERRRGSRADRKAARERRKAGDEAEIARKEADAVARYCARRTARKLHVFPIQASHLFWSLRRFGVNVLLTEYREVWWRGGWYVVPPEHSPAFRWWKELDRRQRAALLTDSGRQSVQAVPLTNPKLLIDRRHDDGSQWGRLEGVKMGYAANTSECED